MTCDGARSEKVLLLSPVGLLEDAVDLLEVDVASAIADGLEQRCETEISCASQDAFGGTHDEGEGVICEGGMRQFLR